MNQSKTYFSETCKFINLKIVLNQLLQSILYFHRTLRDERSRLHFSPITIDTKRIRTIILFNVFYKSILTKIGEKCITTILIEQANYGRRDHNEEQSLLYD